MGVFIEKSLELDDSFDNRRVPIDHLLKPLAVVSVLNVVASVMKLGGSNITARAFEGVRTKVDLLVVKHEHRLVDSPEAARDHARLQSAQHCQEYLLVASESLF
jgi:hypothetical protein